MVTGKGIFIWQVQNCEGGDPDRIVAVARAAGLQHVAVKVADGEYSFPDVPYEAMTVAAIRALKDAGLAVWGWQFVYGRDPHETSKRIAEAEAQIAVQRVQALDLEGLIIDFENTGNAVWTYHGDAEDARVYAQHVRAGLPGVPLAAASHRFPSFHLNLPWQEFLAVCDLAMPQVYWVQGEPVPNLRASWEEYQARWPHLPYVPIGAAYAEGGWSASPDEITAFLHEARRMDLPAVSFWSWEHARYHPDNAQWPGTELWDAIAAFDWEAGSVGDPERFVWVTATAGLKFRRQPSVDDGHWIDRVIFFPGTRLTAIGTPTGRDASGYRWQRVRAPDGREGWVTYAIGEDVYLTSKELFSPPSPGSPERQVEVTASWGLKFRAQTLVDDAFWIDDIVFTMGAVLTAIGEPTSPDAQAYRWQYVRGPDRRQGWVAYSIGADVYLEDLAPATLFPPPPQGSPQRLVQVTASLGLKFRRETSVDDRYWIEGVVFSTGTVLTAIGAPTSQDARAYRWQYVRAPDGREGWVAYSIGDEVYLLGVEQKPTPMVWSQTYLNVRDAPTIDGAWVWTVADDVPLTVLEDPAAAGTKVGVAGQWVRVRTPSLKEGYVSAEYVRAGPAVDVRTSVERVPPGESPYLFGFHDPFDRGVFAGSDRTGWVLVTEQTGIRPSQVPGNRNVYYDWSRAGFGVIVRLNHGYHGAGTLPPVAMHDLFVEACARWVHQSIDPGDPQHGAHIWIIGNEMNNPREWPGNQDGLGGEPITPESYAACFNKVYRAIKSIQPGAIVCPGAVDPYNAIAGDPRIWFRKMLQHIEALDGFALHTYTHGTDPALVTSPATFGDAPLTWQYYNFYAYRTFMDLIPGRWREAPVFITETDQVEPWANTNSGWVREAYAEIDRWNRAPHHQQIRCLLLYRWWPVDRWGLEHKPGVHDDLRLALRHDYRWRATQRRGESGAFAVSFGAGPAVAPPAEAEAPPSREALGLPEPDDLQRLWSIGPKTEAALNALGIYTFAQLAELAPGEIRARLAATGARGQRILTWPKQARLAAEGNEIALQAYQETLNSI